MIAILKKSEIDSNILSKLINVIESFHSIHKGVGLPLGNLTSQLLVNIYMNNFDQWVKRNMKMRFYIRYADDFVFFDIDKDKLLEFIPKIAEFLEERLKLALHPDKVLVKTLVSGVDFLGWVHFPTHRVLRTKTKRRMLRALSQNCSEPTRASYWGLLKPGNTYKLQKMLGYR